MSSKQKECVGIPRSEPFLFGSPLPKYSVSKKVFDTAAASVLEEMNKRLSAAGGWSVHLNVKAVEGRAVQFEKHFALNVDGIDQCGHGFLRGVLNGGSNEPF